jgi:mutator protein MutT
MKTIHTNLLFLLKDTEILLAMKKRGFGKDRWNGVGGKIEPGETIEIAVRRECQEEIAVTPQALTKVALLEFINKDADDQPYLIIVHVFTCTQWKGQPTETEEMAPQWYAQDAIPYDKMWQDDIFWLPLVLEGKKVKGIFEFDKDDNILSKNVKTITKL